jgi:hypothetical protein
LNVGLDEFAGGFFPQVGERIGELRKNPQYPEMGIFQGMKKELPRRVVREHLS